MPPVPKSQSTELYDSRTEETLSVAAKLFRDRFVIEYIVDYDGPAALARCGYVTPKKSSMYTRASQLLREPYVAKALKAQLLSLREDNIVTRAQVLSKMWKEANDEGNEGGVRVAACAHVAKMLGMMLGPTEEKSNEPIGVMMIPVVSLEDWGATANIMQAALKLRACNAIDGETGLPIPQPLPIPVFASR